MARKASSKRSDRSGDRRTQILDAAIRVFAQRGYHGCRVSDIADEAGIAYGLVYHYYQSKEAVLQAIFDEKWAMFLQVLQSIGEDTSIDFRAKIRSLVSFVYTTYRQNPAIAEVVILEILHSHEFRKPDMLDRFGWAYTVIQKMFRDAQKLGQVSDRCDVQYAPLLLLGSIETLLTGLALKYVSGTDAAMEQISNELVRQYAT